MNKNQPTEKISRTYCGCIPKGSDVDKDWQVVLNPTLCSFSHVLSGHGNQSSLGKPVSEQTYLRIKPLYNQPLLLFPFPLNCFVHIFLSYFLLYVQGMRYKEVLVFIFSFVFLSC